MSLGTGIASSLVVSDGNFGLMLVCCSGLAASYILLLASIEGDYVWTFFDTRTGYKFLGDTFRSETDEEDHLACRKFEILGNNENVWRRHCGEEVKTWLTDKLPVWLEEQPAWFGALEKALIPDWAVTDPDVLANIRDEEVVAIISERATGAAFLSRSGAVGVEAIQLLDEVFSGRRSGR